jgi:hypothetical protein
VIAAVVFKKLRRETAHARPSNNLEIYVAHSMADSFWGGNEPHHQQT